MSDIVIRDLGARALPAVWTEMQRFTAERGAATPDEIWFVEHPPVFTLGLSGNRAHLLDPGDVPVVQTDRGGQVTFHGPGQLVCYVLIELKRVGLNVRSLVQALESAVIDTARDHAVEAYARRDAPGVYVAGRKLAAVGLRVRRGCSYHGIAINVRMDLEPFTRIDPCGYPGLEVTQLADHCAIDSLERCRAALTPHLLARLRAC
ncbi:MAG TPA: lipoyl(octanoyl) transferase LipB [Gammaproteobacteria bacterium]